MFLISEAMDMLDAIILEIDPPQWKAITTVRTQI
jgi:hypothetical protein